MWASIIAAASALVGVALSTILQQRLARQVRTEARTEERRRDTAQSVAALATAIADHRRAMWVREEARLTGVGSERVAALRSESHITRSAITAPQMMLAILAPALADAADEAIAATYAMRNATAVADLEGRRDVALTAMSQFAAAARAELSHHG